MMALGSFSRCAHLESIASSSKVVQVALLECFNEGGTNATGTTASDQGCFESHDSDAG